MNRRGQAALEYLMTYGWALIVIAIVVGVLVFIVSSPAGNIVCNSDDPAKMMVKASQIDSAGTAAALTSIGTVKLTNLTGGNITSVSCTATGGFETPVAVAEGCIASVVSGAEMELTPLPSDTPGTYGTSTIVISYIDYATLSRTATVTCSGPLTLT